MSWLELIGKLFLIGGSIVMVVAIMLVLLVVVWLAYESANGRNPFL